jgi:aryl-alcohol dehydrogenase-like predicted oxidoreductase
LGAGERSFGRSRSKLAFGGGLPAGRRAGYRDRGTQGAASPRAGPSPHVGLSNVSADQLRTALSITDIAAVTVQYNVAVRLGAAVRQVARDAGIVFSPWHPGVVPRGDEGEPFHAVIDPIAAEHDATPEQIALAWQLHRSEQALPIPGTTSVQHLQDNLAAAHISLTQDEVDAITALAPEDI